VRLVVRGVEVLAVPASVYGLVVEWKKAGREREKGEYGVDKRKGWVG